MTKERETELIGKAALEASEIKRHIGLLESRLKEASRKVENLPLFLRRCDAENVIPILKDLDTDALIADAEMLARMRTRYQELKETLKNYNVEI